MTCKEMEGRLDDLADGSLDDASRAEVERHVMGCPACRRDLDETRALLADLSALPKTMEPTRDLWPESVARIRQQGKIRRQGETPRRSMGPRLALAAGIALVAVTAAVTALLLRPSATDPSPYVPAAGAVATASRPAPDEAVAAAEAEFHKATVVLLEVLHSRDSGLPRETVVLIENNLKIIDRAIAEARAASDRDPSNARLGRLIAAAYEMKLDLLREASKFPGRSEKG